MDFLKDLKEKTKYRWIRNYLISLLCTMEKETIEYKNIQKRIAWIETNKL